MKQFIFLLLLAFFTSEVFPQQEEATGAFVHLTKVDHPPVSADCAERSSACTAATIEKFLLENITAAGPLADGNSGKIELPVRVIIDSEGKISWASVRGIPEEAGNYLAARLKEMSPFSPGEHEGAKANVIVDLKLPLYLSEPEDLPVTVVPSDKVEQQPMWKNCRKENDPEACTETSMNDWMNRSVRISAIKKPGNYELTAAFVVGVDGKVSRIVVHGGGDEFATEVMDQLKRMPKFEPARTAEGPVAVSLLLPMSLRKS